MVDGFVIVKCDGLVRVLQSCVVVVLELVVVFGWGCVCVCYFVFGDEFGYGYGVFMKFVWYNYKCFV